VFRNYDRPDSEKDNEWYFNTGDASVAKVWKVARATSAAPLYFSKQIIGNSRYLDGGMGCKNPAELMSHEIKGVHGREPDLILSIGTGTKPRADNESGEQHKARKHKLLDNARSVLHAAKTLPDIATESEKFHLRLKSNLDSLRTRGDKVHPMYFRFNVPDLGTMELDAWKSSENSKKPDGQQTLRELHNKTLRYLDDDSVQKGLEACAKELVRIRRERAATERWEQFATYTTYFCPEKGGHECESLHFTSRDKLRSHALERHEYVPWVALKGNPICFLGECAEHPQLFEGKDSEDQLLRHLKGPSHNIKDAKPISTAGLEEWLDRRRITRDAAFHEYIPALPQEQNDLTQLPADAGDDGQARTPWSVPWSRHRRSPVSESDLQSNRRRSGPRPLTETR
jgi:hypothetical protein